MGKPSLRKMHLAFEREKRQNACARPGCHEFIMVCDRLKANFNIGKIFRSAAAFGAQAVYLVGIESFNPYPARGAFRQVPARFFDQFTSCYEALRGAGYSTFLVEPGAHIALFEWVLPEKSAFVVGHEEFGPSFRAENYPDITPVRIPMYGQIESLNVSVAAAIVMYEYVRQHGKPVCRELLHQDHRSWTLE